MLIYNLICKCGISSQYVCVSCLLFLIFLPNQQIKFAQYYPNVIKGNETSFPILFSFFIFNFTTRTQF